MDVSVQLYAPAVFTPEYLRYALDRRLGGCQIPSREFWKGGRSLPCREHTNSSSVRLELCLSSPCRAVSVRCQLCTTQCGLDMGRSLSERFGFLLSLSFHQCSLFIIRCKVHEPIRNCRAIKTQFRWNTRGEKIWYFCLPADKYTIAGEI